MAAAAFVLIGGVAVAQSLDRSEPRADQVVTATTPDEAGPRPATRTSDEEGPTVPENTSGSEGAAPAVGATSTSEPAVAPTTGAGAGANIAPPTMSGSSTGSAPRRSPGGTGGAGVPTTTGPGRSTTPDRPPTTAGPTPTTAPRQPSTIDQQADGTPQDLRGTISTSGEGGQTFTAGRTGLLDRLDLRLANTQAGTLDVRIEAVADSGLPNGIIVGRGRLVTTGPIDTVGAPGFTAIELDQPAQVVAGISYAFIPTTGDQVWQFGDSFNEFYAGGSGFFSDGHGGWVRFQVDWMFRTWVSPS